MFKNLQNAKPLQLTIILLFFALIAIIAMDKVGEVIMHAIDVTATQQIQPKTVQEVIESRSTNKSSLNTGWVFIFVVVVIVYANANNAWSGLQKEFKKQINKFTKKRKVTRKSSKQGTIRSPRSPKSFGAIGRASPQSLSMGSAMGDALDTDQEVDEMPDFPPSIDDLF